MKKHLFLLITSALLLIFLGVPDYAYAMHIMEGFLPRGWSAFWFVITLPFVFLGIKSIQKKVEHNPSLKFLLGVVGAFAFVLSALKLPSITGSSSHPTGIGLGAIMFGPVAMSVIGVIVLIFQALLLAHGGITTLGANAFSMAVVGPFIAFAVFKIGQKLGAPTSLAVFLAAFSGNIMTYVVTSMQLAIAFPAIDGGIATSLVKFLGVFAVTQIPLAISEGLLTVIVFNFLKSYSKNELQELAVISKEV